MNSIVTTAPAKMLAPGSGQQETRPEDLLWDSRGRIRTKDPSRDRTLHLFLLAFVILGVLALVGMKLDMEQQLALCRRYDIRLDELEQHALKLLHAKTGAAVARDIFGVKDAVYKAIRWHTTGKPDMSLVEKVIYLADYIEPNRDFPGVERLRRAVYDDLDKGLLMGLSDTIDEMERMGNPVHHDTLEARDFLLRGEAK